MYHSITFPEDLPSLKLTVRHRKSTFLMVFTRKQGGFHGRAVSFREGIGTGIFTYIDG